MKDNLSDVFIALKGILKEYEKNLTPVLNFDTKYELWSFKDIMIGGKKTDSMFFAGLAVRKDYVGFYFMPLYVDPGLKNLMKPELLKLLKGKTCFHIKKLDDVLVKQIEEALKTGYELFVKLEWV